MNQPGTLRRQGNRSPRLGSGLRLATRLAAWALAVVMIAAWCALWLGVDRWWLATALAFGPRWLFALLAVPLALAALAWHRRALLPVGLAILIALGPIQGLCLPWKTWTSGAGARFPLRVMSWNVGGQTDLEPLGRYVEQANPEIVFCQEWPTDLPWPCQNDGEWHVALESGLLVASRFPINKYQVLLSPNDPWRRVGLACELQRERSTLHCVCLHLPTPRPGFEAMRYHGLRGLPGLEAATRLRSEESSLAAEFARLERATLVAGDFNMSVESQIYQQDWKAFSNVFSGAGWGYGHTKHTRWFGVRIDHILVGPQVHSERAWVGPQLGSDHRPLLADIAVATVEGGQP